MRTNRIAVYDDTFLCFDGHMLRVTEIESFDYLGPTLTRVRARSGVEYVLSVGMRTIEEMLFMNVGPE